MWLAVSVSVVALGACSSGGGSAGGSTEAFCNALRGYTALFAGTGAESSDEQKFEDALADLANKAPSEIKADMTSIAASVKTQRSLASAGEDDPSKLESLESQFSAQGPALDRASANIEKFAKDKCGVDLNSNS